MAKYENTHKIIQWNCRGYKANYNELQLLITEQNPTIICLQETFKKSNDKTKMKNYEQYDYIHDTELRASGGVSILIRKNLPQSKINISTPLQAVAISATLHKTTTICSIYIPPQDPINKEQLNNLINQLPKPYILMGDFNSHNILWGSRTMNKRGQTLEKIINNNNLCLHTNCTATCPLSRNLFKLGEPDAGHCWRSRDELIRDVLLWIPTHGRAKAGRPARTYIQQLCEDTGCCPEDLPRAMNDREEWRERVRDIRAASTIWWWWWWCLHNRKAQTHLSSSSGTFSAIDLTLSDPATFIEDSCDSDHFPIIIENTKPGKSDPQTVSKTPRWNFKKANWQAYKKLCLDALIPETNTNQEEPITHFTNTLINIANKTIPKTTNIPKT